VQQPPIVTGAQLLVGDRSGFEGSLVEPRKENAEFAVARVGAGDRHLCETAARQSASA